MGNQVHNAKEFQNYVQNMLGFTPHPKNGYILYQNEENPEIGSSCIYEKKDAYQLGIADYRIPKDFSLSFENADTLFRFGTLFTGQTYFKMSTSKTFNQFTPSSFYILEEHILGKQHWKQGTHYRGIEFTVYPSFLQKIEQNFPGTFSKNLFTPNKTIPGLPPKVLHIFEEIQLAHAKNTLDSLALEGYLYQCLSAIAQEQRNSFFEKNNPIFQKIKIGKNRYINLTRDDTQKINQAHRILTQTFQTPPSVETLAEEVLLPVQKLNYGFHALFQQSIHSYLTELRMTRAANLLLTTEKSVEEISKESGYSHPSSFIQVFKKYHGKTPYQFRIKND